MSPVLIGLIGFLVLFMLLAAGMPIGFALATVGFTGMCLLYPLTGVIIKMSTVPYELMSSYSLAVLPLFLLMANIIFVSGLGTDLFNLAAKWLGRFRGGLAMAGIGGATGFAAVSGSSLATAATMGLVALPEMKKYGYEPRFAAGSIAAGGTIGSLLPPSAMFIIYGIITENSVGKLFAGSIIPAFLTALSYILTIYILCRRNPKLGPPAERTTWRQKFVVLGTCWQVIVLVIFVIGGMLIGWFTATEAGAVGAIGAFVLALVSGRLNAGKIAEAFRATMRTSGMIYGIMLGAFIFNSFCAKTTLPQVVAEWAGALPVPGWVIMSVIILVYFLMGTVMEAPSIQLHVAGLLSSHRDPASL